MATRTVGPRARLPTRARILNEAERLIALKGVFGFTLGDIAAPLAVQVPTIYQHFKGRDDVLIEVSRRFIDNLSRQFRLPGGFARSPALGLRRSLNEFGNFHSRIRPTYDSRWWILRLQTVVRSTSSSRRADRSRRTSGLDRSPRCIRGSGS